MVNKKETIRKLQDEVREINESSRNKGKKEYWEVVPNDKIATAMIRVLPRFSNKGIPFVVEPAKPMFSKLLGFSLGEYYQDPLTYLIAELKQKLFVAKEFDEDTYIDKKIRLYFGMLLEGSLFGMRCLFSDEINPTLKMTTPVINSEEDLKKLKYPDFYDSGIMPILHKFYEEINKQVESDFRVLFPDWIMGPFGVACCIRGFERFIMDLVTSPQFAKDLLGFIVEARKRWTKEKAKFLGENLELGIMGNDDVGCPTLSPKLYKDMILPYEKKLRKFYGNLFYWHSCADVTKLLPYIHELSPCLLHVGPWTDIEKSIRIFGGDTPLEICLDPVSEFSEASESYIRNKVRKITELCEGNKTRCYIKLDSIESFGNLKKELQKSKVFCHIAQEVTKK